MTLVAFNGGAGCGKTTAVMKELRGYLENQTLLPYQRVLALTYMHGARIRLDEQLGRIKGLGCQYEASTVDSFAWHLCRRWAGLLREVGLELPHASEYSRCCEAAAALLAVSHVQHWVSSTYPLVLIDEAQDLEVTRLELVAHMLTRCSVVIAFDEFQCLNPTSLPLPIETWTVGKCVPTILSLNHRTNHEGLLSAAHSLRNALSVRQGSGFMIKVAPARSKVGPYLAATHVAYRISKGGSFALITPSSKSAYVRGVVELLQTKTLKGNLGPFLIDWEGDATAGLAEIKELIDLDHLYEDHEVDTLLAPVAQLPATELARSMLLRLRSTTGTRRLTGLSIASYLERAQAMSRQYRHRGSQRLTALTAHRAKNREFDHVAVVWTYLVPADADHRRRLLYNAITRARKSCLVIVENDKLLKQPPFV